MAHLPAYPRERAICESFSRPALSFVSCQMASIAGTLAARASSGIFERAYAAAGEPGSYSV